jgi:ribosomal protein L29
MSSKKAIATKTLRAKNDEELLKELKTLRVKYVFNNHRKNYKISDLPE